MNDPDNSPLSFWQVLLSVLAAAFGLQSGKNRRGIMSLWWLKGRRRSCS